MGEELSIEVCCVDGEGPYIPEVTGYSREWPGTGEERAVGRAGSGHSGGGLGGGPSMAVESNSV